MHDPTTKRYIQVQPYKISSLFLEQLTPY